MDDVYYIRGHGHINEIERQVWDGFANQSSGLDKKNHSPANPFIMHDFLLSLEESGAVSIEAGWQPHHLSLETKQGNCLGVMPLYLKSHSQGEYVFDHGWADAYIQAGGRYYPKLLSSVPFTPVTGPRLLVANNDPVLKSAMARGALALMKENQLSSCHINFIDPQSIPAIEDTGYLIRQDSQFHWRNEGYQNFDEFLRSLTSRKRKAIIRERRKALENDIEIVWLTGDQIKERHWDGFYQFYLDTGRRKWGNPYLNRTFFSLIGERLANQILLIFCKRHGEYIAGALNFIGIDTLFGRYWGQSEHHNFLHFETCYYQAMEFAITHKLGFVEAGAQGHHKLARGYEPTTTYSAHGFTDPRFGEVIAHFLSGEGELQDLMRSELESQLPFKKNRSIKQTTPKDL